MRKVYLDNAATTCVSNEVINEMMPCFNTIFGNPSSLHSYGREAAGVVDRARDRIAKAINAEHSNEIYFTSGGTEADNWAIKGIAHANKEKGKSSIMLFWKLAKNLRAKVLKLHIFLLMNMELFQSQNLCTTSEKTPF